MSELEQSRDHFLSLWDAFAPAAGECEGAGWARLRREARDLFAERGLPTTRLEEWRYTNVLPLAALRPGPAPAEPAISRDDVEAVAFPVFACSLVVFVNGRHRPDLSSILPGGNTVRVEGLASLRAAGADPGPWARPLAEAKEHPFLALNRAFIDDGCQVRIPPGPSAGPPLHVVFASGGAGPPGFSQPRLRIDAEAGSRAVVVQDHVSLAPGAAHFTNAVTEVRLGPGASLDLVVVQREGDETFHVSNLAVQQARDSQLRCHVLTLGGALVRNDLSALLMEEGVTCTLRGLFLGSGGRLADNHTLIDHAAPHGTSEEVYKGILAGRSRGVFRGRVVVRPHAQKTSARQSNPNLLLSDGAEIDTKPQLEIWADDVKCSHGSAIGRTDPDALFYLQARGIDPPEARRLLTRGFAAEILGTLPGDALREGLVAVLDERLAGLEVAR